MKISPKWNSTDLCISLGNYVEQQPADGKTQASNRYLKKYSNGQLSNYGWVSSVLCNSQ